MIETITLADGTKAPLVTSENFLVDFGPSTRQPAKDTWLAAFKLAVNQTSERTQGIAVAPVEVMAWGASGRTVLRIWAPDPVQLVIDTELAMQDGPKVVLL
jgi:hypothetical protein